MKKLMMSLVGTVATFAALLGVVWFFFGTTVVVSMVDGKEVTGAQVLVNDKVVGSTPYKARLGFGHHKITIMSPDGYLVEESQLDWHMLTVVRAEALEARFHARPSTEVEISCFLDENPMTGCPVLIDGARVGSTPFNATLPPGKHTVTVKSLNEMDAKESARYIEADFRETDSYEARFNRRPDSKVTITCLIDEIQVAECPIFVDDVFVGNAPLSYRLPPGKHKLVVKPNADIGTKESERSFEGSFHGEQAIEAQFAFNER